MTDRDDIRERHLRRGDFLGAFGVLESERGILMVQNRRTIGGREQLTWDLPGGQVEPGETLEEALARELREEIAIDVRGDTPFLFYQEGERRVGGVRQYVWRSFFFAVPSYGGEPRATGEVLAERWVPRPAMAGLLGAPYHDSFVRWLAGGGSRFRSAWND